ncbi:RNA polymerase sigma factor [Saccharopolyspora taberi]|uniref:Sigma factor-like helix-turn-helix DNA-binding protein n=1 Tax=Saccharopolyspora taberi TaxID=60895 RepID=A0ABN3VJN9_9PSEU
MSGEPRVEDLLRELAPQVLGAVVRHRRDFELAEEAVQEALLAAAVQWPERGVPDKPRGWLIRVADRRMTDLLRSELARQERELTAARLAVPGAAVDSDDTLVLLMLCCHPALSPASRIALTLRAVGGLTTAQIAQAFLVPESTMAQRISRAKKTIRAEGARFRLPPRDEFRERLDAVLHVLYLIFNEGYTASGGPQLQRTELADEAIRLTRQVHALLPEDGEIAGLLALMLLTDARRPARTGPDGALIPLAEQDRTRWNQGEIAEGVELITRTLAAAPVGPYQLQAAIAAVHDEAPTAEDTDWPQILALYGLLSRHAPNPVVTLNHAVAVAMVHGPQAGLEMVDELAAEGSIREHHRTHAVRAHLAEMAGDRRKARVEYRRAASLTTSDPEQRYLLERAARLD